MALPEIPSITEVLKWPDPIGTFEKLPWPFREEILKQFRRFEKLLVGATNIPENPVEMALKHPKYKWMDSKHIHYLGERIVETVEACGALAVSEPPQHAKSSTCSIWTPFWFLARDPEAGVLLISYEATFARKWGVRVRNLVQSYGKDYGLELDPKQAAGDDWSLTTGGGMSCTGIGGKISGRYVKLLLIDDPIKNWEESQSETIRESMWEWWEGTVEQRIQHDTTVIVIGTRYREDDLIGRILKKSKDMPSARQFTVISFPAKAESNDILGRAPGEGLWLANKPQSWYDQVESTSAPHVYSAVHQQHPSPPGGNMVDPIWWRYYRVSELPESFDQMIQSWDLSLDAQKRTDSYHAGLVLGRKGALVYVVEMFREHCGIDVVMDQVMKWARVYPKARTKLVERYASGTALVQSMRSRVSGLISWPPKGKHKGSKESCLDAIIPDIRSGNVLLQVNWDGLKPKWTTEIVEELRQFPRGAHDDIVDSLSQGVGFLLPSVRGAASQAHSEALLHRSTEAPEDEHRRALHASLKVLMRPRIEALREHQEMTGTIGGPSSSVLQFEDPGQRSGQRSGQGLRRMW